MAKNMKNSKENRKSDMEKLDKEKKGNKSGFFTSKKVGLSEKGIEKTKLKTKLKKRTLGTGSGKRKKRKRRKEGPKSIFLHAYIPQSSFQ